jgi:protein O-GlcNAc transferase
MFQFEEAKNAFIQGIEYMKRNEFEKAILAFNQSLEILPNRASTLINLSATLIKVRRFDDAIDASNKALLIDNSAYEAWCNKGICYSAKRDFSNAITCFDTSLELNSDYIEAALSKAKVFIELNEINKADAIINFVISRNPTVAQCYAVRAANWVKKREYKFALDDYDKAIYLAPNSTDFYLGKTIILNKLEKMKEALETLNTAIQLAPLNVNLWVLRGQALIALKKYQFGIDCYQKAFDLDPTFPYLIGDLIGSKLKICDWSNLDALIEYGVERTCQGHPSIPPFTMLSVIDSPNVQLIAAKNWTREFNPIKPSKVFEKLKINEREKSKVKIAYFSMDYRIHPVSYLTAELFELHDRENFEVYAFSYGPNTQDEMRRRLERSFDKFIDVEEKTDSEIVEIANNLGIDIAIDLAGHTLNSRSNIFSSRLAPIQINYLGYPGTSGDESIDYIIADEILIPNEYRKFYSEKILYLPFFQANDTKRYYPDSKLTRSNFGLSEDSFVFCSFNSNSKITPLQFASWMRILEKTPNSVLFLYAENEHVPEMLRSEAIARGVSSDRLIFSGQLPLEDHLKRYQMADLFLDTSPFCAGTTASDALWADLPLLTLSGNSYSSRMATSLLKTLGLDSLIATSRDEYESKAIHFALNRNQLSALKDTLIERKKDSIVFNSIFFVRNMEAAYIKLIEKSQ